MSGWKWCQNTVYFALKALKVCWGGLDPVGCFTVYSLTLLASIEMKLDAVICLDNTLHHWCCASCCAPDYCRIIYSTNSALMERFSNNLWYAYICWIRSQQIASWPIVHSSDTIHNLYKPYLKIPPCNIEPLCWHLQTLKRAHSWGTWICKMEQCKDEDREVVTSLQSLPLGLIPCPFSSYVLVQHPN